MAEPNDIPAVPDDAEETQVVHHTSQRKKRRKDQPEMELQLTSMIDVIFQLLIYFVITANFMIDEGTIKATMPGQSAPPKEIQTPDPPVYIDLVSADDGVTYSILVDQRAVPGGASELHGYLAAQLASNRIEKDSDIQIRPQGRVRWQHVVNVFNACTRADLEKVGFATPN